MSRQPNIIFVLAENIGWSDLGYQSDQIPTNFLDELAFRGIRLTRHYVQSSFTPTAASFLTGRYAFRTALTRDLVPGSTAGLIDTIETLPSALSKSGYSTAMVGAWNLGNSQWKLTPVAKGFDEHVGSYAALSDSGPESSKSMDWVHAFRNGSFTHYAEPRSSVTAVSMEAARIIQDHVGSHGDRPLFLYISYSSSSRQVSSEFASKCKHIRHLWRRQHCESIAAMDEGLRQVVKKATDQLGEDTLFVFSSGSGGSPWRGGLNSPLRGAAGTPLEGGIRGASFIVDLSEEGKYLGTGNWEYNGLTHICDWYPTLVSLAKGSIAAYSKSGGDGIDMTVTLKYYRNRRPHRDEALLEMHHKLEHGDEYQAAAYIVGDMKFIEGKLADLYHYTDSPFDGINYEGRDWSTFVVEKLIRLAEFVFDANKMYFFRQYLLDTFVLSKGTKNASLHYLFNVTADPIEKFNLYDSFPNYVLDVKEKMNKIRKFRSVPTQLLNLRSATWSTALVDGDCSMVPSIKQSECRFVHPWIPDDADQVFIQRSSELVDHHYFHLLFGAVVSVSVILLSVIFLCKFSLNSVKPKVTSPAKVEKPKQ